MLTLKENIEKEEWNAFVAANAADGGVLQSWEWGELEGYPAEGEARQGRQFWRLAWEEGGELVAVCLLVEWKLSPLSAGPRQRRWPFGWTYVYAPRGPVVLKNHRIIESLNHIFDELKKFAREQGAIFLRLEFPYTKEELPVTSYQLRVAEPVQPHQTLRIDLTQSEDALLKVMHQKTRYNIGLAEKRGVSVSAYKKSDLPSEVGLRHIEMFFNLLQTTTTRDGFRMHPRAHYETILAILDATLFFAEYNRQPLATALVAFFGNTAYYLHGASANEHRDVMAPYALHWHIMREAKRRGCTTYDLWGVDEKKWLGVTRFKQGFAPNTPFTTYAGTYDLPIRKIPYALYRAKKRL